MQDSLTVRELGDSFWLITDPGYARPSHCYLIVGDERSALIDTGIGMLDIRKTAEEIAGNEIVVLQTHAHPDHAGGSHRFDSVYAHPRAIEKLTIGWTNDELRFTIERYFKDRPLPEGIAADTFTIPPCNAVFPLEHRGVVDLGQRQLDVFFTPGHSADSVCYLDLEHALLFTGDSVLKGQIAVENSAAYRRSLLELRKLASLAEKLYPAHGETPIEPELVTRVRRGFVDATTDRHPSGFLAGFPTFQFEDFGIMLPPRSRRVREE